MPTATTVANMGSWAALSTALLKTSFSSARLRRLVSVCRTPSARFSRPIALSVFTELSVSVILERSDLSSMVCRLPALRVILTRKWETNRIPSPASSEASVACQETMTATVA